MNGPNCLFSLNLDVSKYKTDGPMQPHLSAFPKTLQGGARRSFRSEWCKEHTWLEYSQSKDAAYCFACRHFAPTNAPKTVYASDSGYSNWKKATFRDSGFNVHAKSETHINAMISWGEHKRMAETNTSVLGMMGAENQKQVVENTYTSKPWLKFCCSQLLRISHNVDMMKLKHQKTKEMSLRY